MILKDEFLVYLENIKKYSNNTIINYDLDLEKFNNFINMKNQQKNHY